MDEVPRDPVVRYDLGDGVTALELNRPHKLNAINAEMLDRLDQHLAELAGPPAGFDTPRALLLRGAGRSFCAGHDFDAIPAADDLERIRYEAGVIDRLEAFPAPTIAAVHGHCMTGGLELVLACDLIVASECGRIADTHGRWGMVPTWGLSVRLPERVGQARAKELAYTSRVLGAREAAAIGLVDHVSPTGLLEERSVALAREISANSPGANRMFKRLMSAHAERPRKSALEFERSLPWGMPADTRAGD